MSPSSTPSPRPLRADAQRNRERVLAAANEVFASEGNGATIELIARRAGVGVGTVCRHFPTKQALLDEVLTDSARELLTYADEVLPSADPALAFERFVSRFAELHARRRAFTEQLAASFDLPRRVSPDLRAALRDRVALLLERAQAAGSIRTDISPAETTMLFGSIAQIAGLAGGDPKILDRYVTVMLDGLRPAAASPLPGTPLEYADVDRLHDAVVRRER